MTIKHTIPKIEWAIELLYNSVKTGSQWVGDQVSWWPDVVEKASRKLSPRVSGWASGERERHNADGHESGGQYVAVLFCLQLPLTHKTFQIKWEVYFSKRLSRSSLLLRQCVFCMYMCIYTYYVSSIQHIHADCVKCLDQINISWVQVSVVSLIVSLPRWVECSPMARATGVQSQIESYQRLKNGTWCLRA